MACMVVFCACGKSAEENAQSVQGVGKAGKVAKGEFGIPAPAGFVNGAPLSEMIRRQATNGQAATVKLLGSYYQTNALAELLKNGRVAAPVPFCLAFVKKEYASEAEAIAGFAELVKETRKDAAAFDAKSPDTKRIVERAEKARKKMIPDTALAFQGATILGTVVDTPTAYAWSILVELAHSSSRTNMAVPLAATSGFVRVGTRQISLSVVNPFENGGSIEWANQMMADWMREIQRAGANGK